MEAKMKKIKTFTHGELSISEYEIYLRTLEAKPLLTVKETSDYFGIGINRIQSIVNDTNLEFVISIGKRKMVSIEGFKNHLKKIRKV